MSESRLPQACFMGHTRPGSPPGRGTGTPPRAPWSSQDWSQVRQELHHLLPAEAGLRHGGAQARRYSPNTRQRRAASGARTGSAPLRWPPPAPPPAPLWPLWMHCQAAHTRSSRKPRALSWSQGWRGGGRKAAGGRAGEAEDAAGSLSLGTEEPPPPWGETEAQG